MSVAVAFVPREPPLLPAAAVATGAAARRLGERLLRMDDASLSALRGVAGPDLLLLLGEGASLPWADGTTYLGVDPDAPRLLLPTALRPDLPADLFERAILARVPGVPGPVAVLAAPRRVIPAASARSIERDLLEARMSRWP